MPTAPELLSPRLSRKLWLTGWVIHLPASPHLPSIPVRVKGWSVQALLDSDSTITLACPTILPKAVGCCGTINVICVHRDAQEVATAYVHSGDESGEWKVSGDVLPDLPAPLILCQHWPGFPRELPAASRTRTLGPSETSGLHLTLPLCVPVWGT